MTFVYSLYDRESRPHPDLYRLLFWEKKIMHNMHDDNNFAFMVSAKQDFHP